MPSCLLGSLRSCRCASLQPSMLYSTVWISTCCSVYVGQSICCGARGEKQWLKSGQDIAVSWPLSWPSSICCVLAPLLLSVKVRAVQFLGLENWECRKDPRKNWAKRGRGGLQGYCPCRSARGGHLHGKARAGGRITLNSAPCCSLSSHGMLFQEQW